MNVVLTLSKRKISFKVCQRTTGGVRHGMSDKQEDSGRSRGQWEDERTMEKRTRGQG